MTDLRISVGDRELEATWNEAAPTTRDALEQALPLEGEAIRWGDELYFDVLIDVPPENQAEAVPIGAIAYWPTGNKLCLFWGPTPASTDGEPRAAAPVNVVATLEDVSPLSDLEGGTRIRFERHDTEN
ncbi:cyclophilin-like family protein [Halostagnicola bangensis]